MPSSEGLLQSFEGAPEKIVAGDVDDGTDKGCGTAIPPVENIGLPVVLSKACRKLSPNSRYCPTPEPSIGPTAPLGFTSSPGFWPESRMLAASSPSI